MPETVLHAESGRATGSAAARRLRADDQIPAVVYGRGMEPLSISVSRSDLRQAVGGSAGLNTVLDLTIDGTVYPSIVKEIQRHPVRRTVQHVDFLQIDLDRDIVVNVPVRMVGEAKDVVQGDGLVDLAMPELEVTTTPRTIPDEVVVEVSHMTMDTVIRVADLDLPSGVTAMADPDSPVVTVLTMRAPVEAEEAEAEEGLEGEEGAEGEEGETPAEAGDDGE
jgi:large subunit ribosomal protein L25